MLNHPLAQYNKTLIGLVGLLCNVAYAYNVVNPDPVVAALLVLATTLGIFALPNKQVPPTL